MTPSGQQFELESEGYRASVVSVGGGLRALTHADRPLIRSWPVDSIMPLYSGALLAPWPNRIGDGRYSFRGEDYQLPLNEVERSNALHGLVAWAEWSLEEQSAAQVTLSHRLWPTPGYPWRLDFTVHYRLSGAGLDWTLTARNVGSSTAPFGASIHPYVVPVAGSSVDEWRVELPASSYLEVDLDRMLPLRVSPVEGTEFDLRSGPALGDRFVDHAYTDLAFDPEGRVSARVLAADGSGTEVGWDRSCPWVQIHTGDRPEPQWHRGGLALEPMTCPPDAFRTGTDVLALEPGAEHSVSWHLRAV